jgi:hypothetical protein
MYRRSSPREKAFAVGILLSFAGLGGIFLLDGLQSTSNLHWVFRFVAGCSLVLGFLLHQGAFFVGVWDRNRVIRRVTASSDGLFWLQILAVILWLGFLPLAYLWVYHYLHRLRS